MTLRELYEKATGGEWRVEKVHDLWVEIRKGYGFSNTMVSDCLKIEDARLIVALHSCFPELEAVVVAGERWHEHDYECATHRFAYGDLSYCSCGLKEFTAALAALREKEADTGKEKG